MLAVDLFCGRGGWAAGLIEAGYQVLGVDIVQFDDYPGGFIKADVSQIDGAIFRGAALVVASPPCTEFSQCWSFNKSRTPDPEAGKRLVDAAFTFARAAEAPIVLENVRGAQAHIGRAKAHCGSFYLWGDVPALLPTARYVKGIYNTKKGYRSDFVREASRRAIIPFELAHHIGKCFIPQEAAI